MITTEQAQSMITLHIALISSAVTPAQRECARRALWTDLDLLRDLEVISAEDERLALANAEQAGRVFA